MLGFKLRIEEEGHREVELQCFFLKNVDTETSNEKK